MTTYEDPAARVTLFDTTLRDGEQSPGISLNPSEKLEIAQQLARLGVDVIEAGFPIASPGDFEAVQTIAREVEGAVICGLARAQAPDVDAAWNAIKDAPRPRIHTFISTSDIHIVHQFNSTREDIKGQARAAVAQAVRRDAFSRSAKAKWRAPADLADQVEQGLRRRVLAGLGLAKRAGELISGYDKTAAALDAGRAAWLIEARDGAADGRRKMEQHLRRSPRSAEVFDRFDSAELGMALGLEVVIHSAFLAGRGAENWTSEVRRWTGFSPA